jgi:hypothetical protein
MREPTSNPNLPREWRQLSGISEDIQADPEQLRAWVEALPESAMTLAEQEAVRREVGYGFYQQATLVAAHPGAGKRLVGDVLIDLVATLMEAGFSPAHAVAVVERLAGVEPVR